MNQYLAFCLTLMSLLKRLTITALDFFGSGDQVVGYLKVTP
jgi:hypothetical protein